MLGGRHSFRRHRHFGRRSRRPPGVRCRAEHRPGGRCSAEHLAAVSIEAGLAWGARCVVLSRDLRLRLGALLPVTLASLSSAWRCSDALVWSATASVKYRHAGMRRPERALLLIQCPPWRRARLVCAFWEAHPVSTQPEAGIIRGYPSGYYDGYQFHLFQPNFGKCVRIRGRSFR